MITEVFARDSYVIANAKDDIKNGDAGKFSNMPRNVYHNRNDAGPLEQKNHLDIAPALLSHLGHRYSGYSFYVKTRTRYNEKSEERMVMRDIYVLDGDEPVGHISRGEAYSNNANGLEFTKKCLHEAGVAIVPGIAFGKKAIDYVRFSFAASQENITQALENIRKIVG